MLNVYDYYEEPDNLTLYDPMNKLLSYLDIGYVNKWGISITKEDLDPIVHIIQKNPEDAYQYAIRVLKGRWEEAEPYIMKSPITAFRYAKFVMRERWPEAEPIIKTYDDAWMHYRQFFNIPR